MGRTPDFIIVGAYKCGTTSLLEYLGQHPGIYLPWLQEPNYFAYEPGLRSESQVPEVEWGSVYRRHRARTAQQYAGLFEGADEQDVVGECSPEYMRSDRAWRRIRQEVPHVKLLALLRNPVERAYSEHQAFVRDGVERDSFEVAIRREQTDRPGYQYVQTGFYGAQLTPYYDNFPRENIRVLFTEDLRDGGSDLLKELATWLGAESSKWVPDVSRMRNVSGQPANVVVSVAYRLRRRLRPWVKPVVPPWAQARADGLLASGLKRQAMPPAARQELIEVYRDDIRQLEDLTGRDLSGWLR